MQRVTCGGSGNTVEGLAAASLAHSLGVTMADCNQRYRQKCSSVNEGLCVFFEAVRHATPTSPLIAHYVLGTILVPERIHIQTKGGLSWPRSDGKKTFRQQWNSPEKAVSCKRLSSAPHQERKGANDDTL